MTFLGQVARHYFDAGGIGSKVFIFPNRRAVAFFRKELGAIARQKGIPVILPRLITQDEFVHTLSGKASAERIHLLLRLYDCYKALNPKAESLDEFIYWGGVILSDFDDVDKYLVDPSHIFTNVSDYRRLQDSFDYLDPVQKEALERFLGNFKTPGRYKEKFLSIWDMMLPLYRSFRQTLSAEGLSYDGMAYRDTAERLSTDSAVDITSAGFPETEGFVFVGLNALNECERRLMRRMRGAGIAEFCWDYCSDMIRNPRGRASMFMDSNVRDFPQAFALDTSDVGIPEVHAVSVPSAAGQASLIPEILSRLEHTDIRTAIVLPDEKALMGVLNSIPEEIENVNVTMGYPMSASGLWTLMNAISRLQQNVRDKDGTKFFYHKAVSEVLSSGLLKSCLSETGLAAVADIAKQARYYVAQDLFKGDPLLETVFTPVADKPGEADAGQIAAIEDYQKRIIETLAPLLKEKEDMSLELDFARDFHLAIGRLQSHRLEIKPATYFKLLGGLVGGASVPFKGEPVRGLQIMGPLETRALDFENLIILGCNEGIFPRRNVAASFIPAELRRGFGLPTYEHQDAVWAYYFYRSIQRCRQLWMLYDSRTEISRSGEPSRYISQMELHFGVDVKHYVAGAAPREPEILPDIAKTPEDIELLRSYEYSPSRLQSYLQCPVKFYYEVVQGLREENEAVDDLDAGMTGSVFHDVMKSIYEKAGGRVDAEYLRSILEDDSAIRDMVRAGILESLGSIELKGRNIITEDILCRYVRKVLERDMNLLHSEKSNAFSIIDLERTKRCDFEGYKLKGTIDRLDSLHEGQVRIVDYKTGHVSDEDIFIEDGNAEAVVDAIFGDDSTKRPKIALQMWIYGLLCTAETKGRQTLNAIYQTARLFTDGILSAPACAKFSRLMAPRLKELLDTICDPEKPFRRTEDRESCKWCDFKKICGR